MSARGPYTEPCRCGSDSPALVRAALPGLRVGWRVRCRSCGASTGVFALPSSAVEAWNSDASRSGGLSGVPANGMSGGAACRAGRGGEGAAQAGVPRRSSRRRAGNG